MSKIKCANYVCLNKASGYNKIRGYFCHSCLISNLPFTFDCRICGKIFSHNTRHSVPTRIPKYCSSKCKRRYNYLKNGDKQKKKQREKYINKEIIYFNRLAEIIPKLLTLSQNQQKPLEVPHVS
jgi:hypothetical protein